MARGAEPRKGARDMAKLTLPDGEEHAVASDQSVAEALGAIDSKLAGRAIACRVNGDLRDLEDHPPADADVRLVLRESEDGLEVMRHSAAHVLAEAVRRLFGDDVRLGIGPAIKDGFYYDFDLERRFTPEDLERIEAEMNRIIEEDVPFEREVLSREEARRRAEEAGEQYKTELIDEFPDDTVTVYRHGGFWDVCRGPHLRSTGELGAVKLLSIAGAYWRGSERNPMLQRIYGVGFWTPKELKKHLQYLEEVKSRDHRLLGKELRLFGVDDEVGAGLILWYPRGARVRATIEEFWRRVHDERGYDLVYTPHIASERVYERSGHLENYADFMYGALDIEGRPYRLKPMNCPGHIKIFQASQHSYRDLPVRYCELGTVYRYERSGTLHGLLRVRGFTQDDAHVFCEPEQLPEELARILELADYMMTSFGFTYNTHLATRPEKSLGTDAEWERSTQALEEALRARKMEYVVDEGDGAFYGPKIDLKLEDALGRVWTGPTIQVDLNLPERFDVTYVARDGSERQVVVVHRTVLGSMERFVGSLIEHYAGAFPLWLAPEQVRVIPISSDQTDYARKVLAALREAGCRATVDQRNEKVGAKIRDASKEKVPYMLILGEREMNSETVSVRKRREGDQGACKLSDFLEAVAEEVEAKA